MKELIIMLITATVSTAGFALIFRIDERRLPASVFCGFVGCAVYLIFDKWGCDLFVSNMIAASVTSVCCELFGRKLRAPALIFITPALIPLVPGRSLYYSMRYLFDGNYACFYEHISAVGKVGLGISLGIIFASVICFALFRRTLFAQKSGKQ